MNSEVRTFIKTYLNIETADMDLKGILDGFNDEWVAAVQSGLASIIETHELSLDDYEALTDFAFDSEEDLYEYLGKVNAYVFHGSEERPWLP